MHCEVSNAIIIALVVKGGLLSVGLINSAQRQRVFAFPVYSE